MINLSNKQYSYLLDRSNKLEELQAENERLKAILIETNKSINNILETHLNTLITKNHSFLLSYVKASLIKIEQLTQTEKGGAQE